MIIYLLNERGCFWTFSGFTVKSYLLFKIDSEFKISFDSYFRIVFDPDDV